jgi:hypothetical protein
MASRIDSVPPDVTVPTAVGPFSIWAVMATISASKRTVDGKRSACSGLLCDWRA